MLPETREKEMEDTPILKLRIEQANLKNTSTKNTWRLKDGRPSLIAVGCLEDNHHSNHERRQIPAQT